MAVPQQITVTGGNLFQIASQYYGDATAWTLIAQINNLSDPMLSGTMTLNMPSSAANGTDGILYP